MPPFSHNGVAYSNKDAFNTAKATQAPKPPAPGGDMASMPHEGASEQPQGGGQDPQQALSAMQQAMQEIQAGQQPSPQVAQSIIEFFEPFAGSSEGGSDSGDPMSSFDQQ